MISEVMRYGELMRREVQTFGELADKLAEGDFADGIRKSARSDDERSCSAASQCH